MKQLLAPLTLMTTSLAFSFNVYSVEAAMVSYALVGNIDSGSLLGETYSGFFRFNNLGANVAGFASLPVSKVQFDFLGRTFTEDQAAAPPTVDFWNGNLLGLNFAVDFFDPSFALIAGFSELSEAYLTYAPTSGEGGFGTLQATAIPEPSALLGLLALGILSQVVHSKKS